jgi:tRNA(Ile)-lysidine synthase
MTTDITTRFGQAIRAHDLLRAGDRIGVAVSGGADSVALLRLLLDFAPQLGIRLSVVHFNHQLRGAHSDADEAFVAALATECRLEFLSGCDDVAAAARSQRWNLEDAARRLRYAFFSSLVQQGRITRVAVAHTADDQAETVLARLARGAGPAGLAAIYPVKGHIIRPLIDVRRAELRLYLTGLGQVWREDSSNQDLTRLRARLRHKVLPMLESEIQPAIVEHLGRLAGMAREDEAFWSDFVADRVHALAARQGKGLSIRCADLLAPLGGLTALTQSAQRSLARRMVRGLISALPGGHQLTAIHVDQVLRLAEAGESGSRTDLPGAMVERSFDTLSFLPVSLPANETRLAGCESKGKRAGARNFEYGIDLDNRGASAVVAVPEISRRFHLKIIDWPPRERDTRLRADVIDAKLLHPPLVIRNWRPGDAIQPAGRGRHKLKEFLRERRVAFRERQGWPVLTSAGTVVWTRGLPVAAQFASGESTRFGVLIDEEAW